MNWNGNEAESFRGNFMASGEQRLSVQVSNQQIPIISLGGV